MSHCDCRQDQASMWVRVLLFDNELRALSAQSRLEVNEEELGQSEDNLVPCLVVLLIV